MPPFAGTVLAEDQLCEVGETMDELRSAGKVRFADFTEKLAAGGILGFKAGSVAAVERGSHR